MPPPPPPLKFLATPLPWYINLEGTISENFGKQSNRIEVVMFKIELCMPAFAANYNLIVINHSCKSKLCCKKVPYDCKLL